MNDFLTELEKSLGKMSAAEKQEIIADYREHFEIGFEAGKTKEQIAAQLGEPRELAKMYVAFGAVEKAHETKSAGNVLRMIGAILRFKIGGGLLIASLYFAALCTMITLFAAAAGFAIGGAGGLGLAVIEFIKGYAQYGVLAVFTGLILASGGILGTIGCVKLWKLSLGNLSYVARKIMRMERLNTNEFDYD